MKQHPERKSLFKGITSVFPSEEIFKDTNADGYPDCLDLNIRVSPGLSDPHVWAGIFNLVARLAMEVTALDLPVVRLTHSGPIATYNLNVLAPGQRSRGGPRKLAAATIRRAGSSEAVLTGSSAGSMMELLNLLAMGIEGDGERQSPAWHAIQLADAERQFWEVSDGHGRMLWKMPRKRASHGNEAAHGTEKVPEAVDLLDLTGPRGVFTTAGDNPRSRRLELGFNIDPAGVPGKMGRALAEIVARLALEATDLSLPLAEVGASTQRAVCLKIRSDDTLDNEIRLFASDSGGPKVISARGNPEKLARALERWIRIAGCGNGPGCDGIRSLRRKVDAFQNLIAGEGFWGRWGRALLGWDDRSGEAMPKVGTKTYHRIAKACELLDLPLPEKSASPGILRRRSTWRSEVDELLDRVQRVPAGNGKLDAFVLVSKSRKSRENLAETIKRILAEKGYASDVRVLNAYKPGLSWLLEVVLPRLQDLDEIAAIDISCRPFVSENKPLEMESRWIQEIYPAPEIMAERLGIESADVRLAMTSTQDSVYVVKAAGASGEVVFRDSFTPRWSRTAYLTGSDRTGWVHPTTGGIRMLQAETVVLEKSVPTDRERFWQTFQHRWLPDLLNTMQGRLDGEKPLEQPAFWEEIRIDVDIDETEDGLGFLHERVCPMEALHEDLYFGLLDVFADFAGRRDLPETLQLGRVVPRVRSKAPGGKPRARLTARPLTWNALPDNDATIPAASTKISAMSHDRGVWRVELDRRSLPAAQLGKFITVARAWGHSVHAGEEGRRPILMVRLPGKKSPRQGLEPGHTAPPDDRVLTIAETEKWVRKLSRLPHLKTWLAARSWQGRPVHAIEAVKAAGGEVQSSAKLRLLKPTLLVNARHHANEVSSTNAVLRLAWFLGATEPGVCWLRHFNVVMIPMENPDGVATFEMLWPDARDHKLHAARYNALGSEYYGDYFRKKPRFPEAEAKQKLWQR